MGKRPISEVLAEDAAVVQPELVPKKSKKDKTRNIVPRTIAVAPDLDADAQDEDLDNKSACRLEEWDGLSKAERKAAKKAKKEAKEAKRVRKALKEGGTAELCVVNTIEGESAA